MYTHTKLSESHSVSDGPNCGVPGSVQDYSWEDHGFSLVNRLYPDVGQMLDEKFQMAASLTYNTMASHKDVDTSMLRRAIWNYIHCMFGIRSVAYLQWTGCDIR